MRKASKVLFLVGAILSIVWAVCYLAFGLVGVILPNSEAWNEAVKEIMKNNPDIKEADIEGIKTVLVVYGVLSLVSVAFAGVNSFFGFKAWKQEKSSKALNVLNIVFGVLSSVFVNLVGAIFAFVANGQEERRAALKK